MENLENSEELMLSRKDKECAKKKEFSEKVLPKYSKCEELISAISHIVGGGLFIVALVLCMVFANSSITVGGRIALIVYCLSVILMFTMSSIYHFLARNTGKKVFRVFDHCAIFIAIAGTYTPLCAIVLAGTGWGFWIGLFVWLLAILGVVLNGVGLNKTSVKVFSMISYLGMGWCIIVALFPLLEAWCLEGFFWALAGGIVYSIGALLYCIGKYKKYIHSVWHFFVLLGAILQFVGIFFYVVL